jgi:hypothetical protein
MLTVSLLNVQLAIKCSLLTDKENLYLIMRYTACENFLHEFGLQVVMIWVHAFRICRLVSMKG